ncbi:MAG: insulinase family protein [Polyangiaceae bacterium]
MKLIVEPSHDLPLISGVVAFRAGSTSDPEGKEGLARLTTRLIRRGTKKLGAVAVEEAVDRLGAELSSDASLGWLSISFEVLTRNATALAD